MIRKFLVTATRTDEYVVEIDDAVFDQAWKDDFEKSFHQIDSIEDIARDLAFHQLRFGGKGSDRFIEGYGPVLRDGIMPFSMHDYKDGKLLPESEREKPAEGLNIVLRSEDDEHDFDIKEIPE